MGRNFTSFLVGLVAALLIVALTCLVGASVMLFVDALLAWFMKDFSVLP